MSANLKLYTDSAGLNELRVSGTVYDVFLGPEIGLEGDTGDIADLSIYIKNIGDKIAQETRLVFNNNPGSMLTARVGSDYTSNTIDIGSISVNAVVPVFLRLTVPTGTLMTIDRPDISVVYKSEA